jgi:hypothetical protein
MRAIGIVVILGCAVVSHAQWRTRPKARPPRIAPDACVIGLGGNGIGMSAAVGTGYFNPASLAGASHLRFTWTHSSGSRRGWWYASSDFLGAVFRLKPGLGLGLSLYYFNLGEHQVYDDSGNLTGWRRNLDLSPTVVVGYQASPELSIGASAGFAYSKQFSYDWWFREGPFTACGFKADLGVQYRAHDRINLGLVLRNIGGHLQYRDESSAAAASSDTLPLLLGFGWEFEPRAIGPLEILLVSDITRDFTADSLPKTGRAFLDCWEGLENGVGLEVGYASTFTLRLGYLEDVAGNRGGIVMLDRNGYSRRRISLLRFLVDKGPGKCESWGFCWGVGLEFGRFGLDIGFDDNIDHYSDERLRLQFTYKLR